MALLAGLVLWLPPRPLHRIHGLGWLSPTGFVDERTLVATTMHSHPFSYSYESGPIHLLDLPTGACRSIALPNDALAEEQTWTDDERAESFRSRWRLGDLEIVGESLVAKMVFGDKDSRLFVLDGRAGEERFRIHLEGRTATILGPDIWIRPREPIRAGATYERVEIATGRSIQTDVLASDINLLETEPSPDGRFVIEWTSSGFTVWNLPSGVEHFTLPFPVAAAFSSNSRWLATWSDSRDRKRRIFRIYDLETKSVVAEHVEKEAGNVARSSVNELRFHDHDRAVLALSGDPSRAEDLPRVDTWLWRTDELIPCAKSTAGLHRTSIAEVHQCSTLQSSGDSRFVVNERIVVDPLTGSPCGAVGEEETLVAVSRSAAWGVVDSFSTMRSTLAGAVARFSSDLALFLAPPAHRRLHNLATGEQVAWLGPDFRDVTFSPDERWLITQDEESIDIWSLPPHRPLLQAFLGSLLVPATLLLVLGGKRLRRKRIYDAGAAEEGAASSPGGTAAGGSDLGLNL